MTATCVRISTNIWLVLFELKKIEENAKETPFTPWTLLGLHWLRMPAAEFVDKSQLWRRNFLLVSLCCEGCIRIKIMNPLFSPEFSNSIRDCCFDIFSIVLASILMYREINHYRFKLWWYCFQWFLVELWSTLISYYYN